MKKVEQVLKNGEITIDYDEKLTVSEIDNLYKELFFNEIYKDRKQHIAYGKIALLSANITYLGNPHPIFKKRIQLKDYYTEYVSNNTKHGLKTIYVGIYSFKKTQLFVVFEPASYQSKKSHNSSAHIYSMNLQYAQKAGDFTKTDYFGNIIHVFKPELFKEYVRGLADRKLKTYSYDDILKEIYNYFANFFKSLNKTWLGIEAYKEMQQNNYSNYRQGEWQGWYFEYLFEDYLSKNKTNVVSLYGDKKKDGIDFDLVFSEDDWLFGDLKADEIDSDIIGNKFDSFEKVIIKHNGQVYYICALCECEKDSKHNYEVTKLWNSYREPSKRYVNIEEIKSGYGNKMKYSVKIKEFNILKIDKTMYEILKLQPYKQGKNSDGKPRQPKLKITKDLISNMSVCSFSV